MTSQNLDTLFISYSLKVTFLFRNSLADIGDSYSVAFK